jgi:regulator of sirC expression with transglutaminase-like and TPR domain
MIMADPRLTEMLDRAAAAPDEAFPLAEAALALALQDRPDAILDPYLGHLEALADETGRQARRHDAAGALAAALRGQFGYRGDDEQYDDLRNADLASVIDRRRGLPVALGILWIHAARANGWEAQGLAFPNHFLIRVDSGEARSIVDPFHDGRALDPGALRELLKQVAGPDAELMPAFHAPVSDRDVLLRLLNNRKIRYLRSGDGLAAAAAARAMSRIAPARAELIRETGLIEARSGSLSAAIATLGRYAAMPGVAAGDRQQAVALIDALRARLN